MLRFYLTTSVSHKTVSVLDKELSLSLFTIANIIVSQCPCLYNVHNDYYTIHMFKGKPDINVQIVLMLFRGNNAQVLKGIYNTEDHEIHTCYIYTVLLGISSV